MDYIHHKTKFIIYFSVLYIAEIKMRYNAFNKMQKKI